MLLISDKVMMPVVCVLQGGREGDGWGVGKANIRCSHKEEIIFIPKLYNEKS